MGGCKLVSWVLFGLRFDDVWSLSSVRGGKSAALSSTCQVGRHGLVLGGEAGLRSTALVGLGSFAAAVATAAAFCFLRRSAFPLWPLPSIDEPFIIRKQTVVVC
jgi:hypothetical protein